MKQYLCVLSASIALSMPSPAIADDSELDPLEPMNRAIYGFNQGLDTMFLNPIAQSYGFLTPQYLQDRVDDEILFFGEPVRILNSILTLNADDFATSMGRLLCNSIFGVGGLYDFASLAGLEKAEQDFGLTLKHYGIGTGPYLVLPVFGPSSFRDTLGLAGDIAGNPLSYTFSNNFNYARAGITLVNNKYKYMDAVKSVERTSLDSYSAFRSIYFQKRGEQQ